MTTPIFYNRYFNKATASRGEEVEVYINIFFVQVGPSTDRTIWFDNIGDNLGGSKQINGPLAEVANDNPTPIMQNLETHWSYAQKSDGYPGAKGCYRFSTGEGGGYWPSSIAIYSHTFHPTEGSGVASSLTITKKFVVHPSAEIGRVIPVPTRSTPCDANNFDADKLMIDVSPLMTLYILNTTPPTGYSRTLTIVA